MAFPLPGLRAALLALTAIAVLATGCDSGSNDEDIAPAPDTLRSIRYPLTAVSNSGTAAPEGVGGTVTFWEINQQTSIITLELEDGPTETNVAHVARIHENSAEDGGPIALYLSPIDGSGGDGTSARIVNASFDDLVGFNGHVNINESVSAPDVIIAQGNIGANADGIAAAGFDFVQQPRAVEYPLTAQSNEGALPTGVGGRLLVQEISEEQTLVTVEVRLDGPTGTPFSHPAHIHRNSASEGGPIAIYLSPIDGRDPENRSSQIVEASIDSIATTDGYVNIHESIDALGTVISQGNIGSNAN
jgi:hypothetical protein